jgi:hypothetical protein
MAPQDPLDDILELVALARPAWAQISDGIRASGVPTCEGDDDGGDDAGTDGGGDEGTDGARDGDGDGDGGEERTADEAAKLRRELQKHRGTERRAKTAERELADLRKKLSEFEAQSLSETERALKQAREEAAAEVAGRYETERRAERLELAVTRQATRGVKLDDDETVKFADPDDALAHLDRAIRRGEIDGNDIYDDQGRVQSDALESALADLLRARPHLQARPAGSSNGSADAPDERRRVADADAGRGRAKDTGRVSVEDDLKHIQARTVRT